MQEPFSHRPRHRTAFLGYVVQCAECTTPMILWYFRAHIRRGGGGGGECVGRCHCLEENFVLYFVPLLEVCLKRKTPLHVDLQARIKRQGKFCWKGNPQNWLLFDFYCTTKALSGGLKKINKKPLTEKVVRKRLLLLSRQNGGAVKHAEKVIFPGQCRAPDEGTSSSLLGAPDVPPYFFYI